MSKNIFDYATKELSQDAFLCWLLDNYNDSVVGPASRRFIKNIVDLCKTQEEGHKSLDVDKITRIDIHTQRKHIDIYADVFVDNEKYEIVIEDKTGSGPHDNQLQRYERAIESFKTDERQAVYKVYYKTGYVEPWEEKLVSDAGWGLYTTEMIENTFGEYGESENQILGNYSEYVLSVINKNNKISAKPMNDWNPEERASFFRVKVAKTLKENFEDKIECYTQIYQGRYSSLMVYYGEQLNKKYRPIIEFFFRKDSPITANIHVETAEKDDTWLTSNIDDSFKGVLLKSLIDESNGAFIKWNKKKCIAKMSEKIEKTNPDEVSQKICERVRLFVDRVSKIN